MASRALAACVVIVLAACGGGDNAPEAGPTPYGGAAIQTAEQVGFIRIVDTSTEPATLEFDEAEWLTGEAAQKAAVEDGQLEPGQPVANDYYIRNTDKATRVLEVGPDTAVTATRFSCAAAASPATSRTFSPRSRERDRPTTTITGVRSRSTGSRSKTAECSRSTSSTAPDAVGYMRKMPNCVSGIGALSAAEIPRARTRRVSSGSMIPSSHSRAVE